MMIGNSEEFRTCLEVAIADFGIEPLTDEQTALLVKHYSMLCKWNERINLTRIASPLGAAKLHYAESLFGAKFIAGAKNVLDIGKLVLTATSRASDTMPDFPSRENDEWDE